MRRQRFGWWAVVIVQTLTMASAAGCSSSPASKKLLLAQKLVNVQQQGLKQLVGTYIEAKLKRVCTKPFSLKKWLDEPFKKISKDLARLIADKLSLSTLEAVWHHLQSPAGSRSYQVLLEYIRALVVASQSPTVQTINKMSDRIKPSDLDPKRLAAARGLINDPSFRNLMPGGPATGQLKPKTALDKALMTLLARMLARDLSVSELKAVTLYVKSEPARKYVLVFAGAVKVVMKRHQTELQSAINRGVKKVLAACR